MHNPAAGADCPGGEFDFLCVDAFMRRMLDARALATAFEIGLIDTLIQDGTASTGFLTKKLGVDDRGLSFLVDLLFINQVVERRGGSIALTPAFTDALRFRDLMEMKLSLSNFAAHDFLEFFSELVAAPGEFMRKARFHRLFAYDRCHGSGEEDRRVTRQWMRVTTVLTKYEAGACMRHHDFSNYRRMLDIGGNSGEFALRLCREHPALYATVFDLPLVCDVGVDHISGEPEVSRIGFVKGDATTGDLPGGYDLVTFKSMLHDLPGDQAKDLMGRAVRSLEPGGTMLVFERAALPKAVAYPAHSVLPFLAFFHSYRTPDFYVRCFEDLALKDITSTAINLEWPFLLVTGVVDRNRCFKGPVF